jgi:hypothetical protein
VLILFVMGATVIFVIGAIVVDIGLWVSERRNAQAAADLAALAAATQLRNPNASADATAKGIEFAQRNGYDISNSNIKVRVNPGVNGDPDQVKVEIEEHGGSLFAGIFGITNMDVGASAIGKYDESPEGPGWAVFANGGNCSAGQVLRIEASDLTVNGSTHSNADIEISGNDNHFNDPVNWVCSNGFVDSGNNNTYPANLTYPVSNRVPPINLTWADIQPYCTTPIYSDPVKRIEDDPSLWLSNDQLKPGVICAAGDLVLSHDDTQGHVTFAARGKLTIEGDDMNLQPAGGLPSAPAGLDRLLAYSEAPPPSDAIEITARGGSYYGYIYAPNSEVEINGSRDGRGLVIHGTISGSTVKILGNDFVLSGAGFTGPPMPPEIHLED